jgi:hypothetical protein
MLAIYAKFQKDPIQPLPKLQKCTLIIFILFQTIFVHKAWVANVFISLYKAYHYIKTAIFIIQR